MNDVDGLWPTVVRRFRCWKPTILEASPLSSKRLFECSESEVHPYPKWNFENDDLELYETITNDGIRFIRQAVSGRKRTVIDCNRSSDMCPACMKLAKWIDSVYEFQALQGLRFMEEAGCR